MSDGIIPHAVATAGIHFAEWLFRLRFLRCRLWRPNADMRVAFSALVRVRDGDDHLLIRNLHRPESFGPIGGVIKYFDGGAEHLERLSFKPQDFGPEDDMKLDLRGFLPRKNLSALIKYFRSHEHRESAPDCVLREFREEMAEIEVKGRVHVPSRMDLHRVRVIEEGPGRIPGVDYTQYRVFEIYDARPRSHAELSLFKRLFKLGASHADLMLAKTHEIVRGRSDDGRVIGSHAAYLIGKKRIRPQEAPFVNNLDGKSELRPLPSR